jgi:PAS domain S-box-containing protein
MRIGELSRRTGVSESTLRAWEQRFAVLRPERTEGGQRLYSEMDVDRINAVNRLVAEGLTLASATVRVATVGSGALASGEGEALLLHQVVQNVDQGIWVSANGRTRYVNRKMAAIVGCSIDELMTRPATDFIDPKDLEGVRERWLVGREGQSQHYEMTLLRADGSPYLAEITTTPLIDASGEYQGAVAVVSDITERSHALAATRLKSALLDSIGEAVIASLPDGTITYANPAAERLFGWRSDELVGQNGLELLPSKATSSSALGAHTQLLSGEPISDPLELTRRDGSRFVAHVSGAPVRDPHGALVGLTAVLVDDSDRVRLLQRNETLRQQLETIATLGTSVLRSGPSDRESIIAEIVAATRRNLSADSAVLYELLGDGSGFQVRTKSSDLDFPEVIPSGSRSMTGYTALVGKAVLVSDVHCDHRFDAAPGAATNIVSAVASPVTNARNVVAVLLAGSKLSDIFDDSAAHVIQSMANLIGFLMHAES